MAANLYTQDQCRSGEDQGIVVRKILDELNLNRASIDSDRKAYDKVRQEIVEVDGSLQNLYEQLKTFSNKLSELYETSACRSSDVNLFTVKSHVIAENCHKLESSIERSRDEWVTKKKELVGVTTELLQCNMAFSREWNCSKLGRDHRKDIQANRIHDLVNAKKDLEYEMDDFLLMQRNVKYAEAERNELEKKFRSHEEAIQEREAEVQRKIALADEAHSNLIQQRQEKSSFADELSRISLKIEQQRAAISFWENRVSETHRIFESQKGNAKKTATSSNTRKSSSTSLLYQSPSLKDQGITDPESNQKASEDVENIGSSGCSSSSDSQYLFGGQSKVRRMFQFKKKSLNEKMLGKGGNDSTGEKMPSFQSSLALLESNNGKQDSSQMGSKTLLMK